MNLQYYFNYVTIVEEGSLTAASRKLHIAQPALSNQIKAMEQKYGTRLFFRGARRLELTDAGMILYQQAKRMCEIEQAAKNEIASGFSGQKGMLRFGMTTSIAGGMIYKTILSFAQKYPQTEIKCVEAGPADLCKMLQNGIIEVATVKTMGDLPENVRVLSDEKVPTVAVYKPGGELLSKIKKDTVTISQLSGVPLAVEEMYKAPVTALFKAQNATAYIKSLSGSPVIPLDLARAGLAVALVSQHAVSGENGEGLIVKQIADGGALSARYCLLAQQGNYRSQVVNNFLGMLAEKLGLDLPGVLPAEEPEK